MNTVIREMLWDLMRNARQIRAEGGAGVAAPRGLAPDLPRLQLLEALAAVSGHLDLGAVQQELENFAADAGPGLGDDLAAALDGIADAAARAGKAFPTEAPGDAPFPQISAQSIGVARMPIVAVARPAAPNSSTQFDDLQAEYRDLLQSRQICRGRSL
jgi:hypothetical protein